MEKEVLMNLIDDEINKESKRIYDILIKLYNDKCVVNMSFDKLVDKYIGTEFILFKNEIKIHIIKLMPLDLYICPNNKWSFVNEEEYTYIINSERYNQKIKSREIITKITQEIIDKITNKDINEISDANINFLDIVNECLPTNLSLDYNFKRNLFDNLILNLKNKKINIISINPLIIKKSIN